MTDQVESPGAPVTVEHTDSDGASFSITTNTQTEKEVREALEVDTEAGPPEKPDLSKSASELGKKGGEAAAKARAKATKETPEEEPPEDEEEPEAAQSKPLGKPRHDPRARVAQVTREHAETKRRLEAEQREKEELRRRLADVEARTRTPEERSQIENEVRTSYRPPEPPGKPKPEDFEEFEQYLEARDDWRDRVREMRYAVERDHHERSSRLHEVKTGFATAIQETLASDADFMDRVSPDVSALMPTFELEDGRRPSAKNWIADELVLSPKDAPALMLYLSEHPDELQRIAALKSHREVTRELARLPLEAAPAGTNSRGRSVSRAFPPIKPVSGKPHVALDEGSDEESFSDFMRREDAREAKRRASRR